MGSEAASTDEGLEPEQSNTLGVIGALQDGDSETLRIILGDRHVKHSGIVRAGIKTPKGSCNASEVATYKEMDAKNLPYAEIDKAMGGDPYNRKSKLRPANVDYFTVRPKDFRNPADATAIMKYADPDGRLRRFPIYFPKGEIDLCIPHGFKTWVGGGSVRCYSAYRGPQLICIHRKDVKSRNWEERPCPGKDNPEGCQDLQKGLCSFGGLIRCCVPGLRGMGEIIIPTGSWYGLGEAVANLRALTDDFRINGTLNGQPFLEARKIEAEVKHEGKRRMQWIITVEPTVDRMELLAAREPSAVMSRARTAMSMFQPPATVPAPVSEEPPETDLAPGEIDPAAEQVVAWLDQAGEHYGIPRAQIMAFAKAEFLVQKDALELIPLATIKEVANVVKARTAKDIDEFRAYLKDLPTARKETA